MIVKYLYKADIFYKIQFDNRNGLISTWVWLVQNEHAWLVKFQKMKKIVKLNGRYINSVKRKSLL